MTDTSGLYHRQSYRQSSLICSCCSPVTKAFKAVFGSCLNRLCEAITGLNKIERTLAGASAFDLLLYQPSNPSRTLDSSVIKRVELLIRPELQAKQNSRLLQSDHLSTDQLRSESESLGNSLQLKSKYIPSLTVALEQIRKAHLARESIVEIQKIGFDSNNPEHLQTLDQIWHLLMDGLPTPQRYGLTTTPSDFSPHEHSWSDVGFQSQPSRDFRGAGFLGAKNLLWFAQKHRLRARQVLALASSHESCLWFPFAATGLNVTVWLLTLMNEGHLDVFFYNNSKNPIHTFNIIYSFVFLEFSRFWRISRPSNILQFGEISRRFLTKIETTLAEMSDPSYHSEWSIPMTSTGDELVEELRCWIDGDVPTNRKGSPNFQQLGTPQCSSASRLIARLSAV